jgi:hypothetical protein
VDNLVEDTDIINVKPVDEEKKIPEDKVKKPDIMLGLGFSRMVLIMSYDATDVFNDPADEEHEEIEGNFFTVHLHWHEPYMFAFFPDWLSYSLMCTFRYRIKNQVGEGSYSLNSSEVHQYQLKTYTYGESIGLNFDFFYNDFLYFTIGAGMNFWHIKHNFTDEDPSTDFSKSSQVNVINYYTYSAFGVRFHITDSVSLGLEAFMFGTPAPEKSITVPDPGNDGTFSFLNVGAVLTAGYAF